MSLQGKKIILGITGGIAAYKMNYLVRDLIKNGAEVKVIMTRSAEDFVSPLTLSTLSRNEVFTDFYDENKNWKNHVELALWADMILIAPCTANTLAKITSGICDNFLMAVYMSAKCPVIVAPAMDLDMYAHPTVTRNLQIAESFGHQIIPAEFGELASGLIGQGRLAETETILKVLQDQFSDDVLSFAGKKFLITAGPTYENIDPVRFIGNHSSGKMGFEIAKKAAKKGAEVILISGPSSEKVDDKNITLHKVTSAQEMFDEVFKYYENVDIAIMSAAVADYTPKVKATEKIKKSENELTIELVKNKDILKTMGEQKSHQFLVGFALETQNEEENAKGKLIKKNLDMIILNSLRDEGAGFANSTNKIKIFTPTEEHSFDLKSKEEVANDILNFIEQKIVTK
ncbi:bifunctional phosphopantothenoylcysteine decarboxylase/phosphopantothenate--cysteine ligase CoaBC [Epilithonimonas hungarica]|uniref:Coenzyme A biosynthesis bifunctional protein CoaBC n=1 Tax=Epilithonimonas hungarica TaxID=454006 RepID=A0A1G7PGF1_9FLAO|nr:bifunctional phosphopantothenoylcysteine decarboxylase/phosphopantothenate--cysteine ligase CoaBC [Epilithonimonas hungarica]SDF85297.1 phosphopantothenoylcysteine decarboxylase / phosphopantothenate--cysteine ligase [Epilithonimonas hungarica]